MATPIQVFKLQIVFSEAEDGPHSSVVLPAGGTVEADLVQLLMKEVAKEDLGMLKPQAQSTAAVETAIKRALNQYKATLGR